MSAVLDKPLTPAALRAACLSALRPGGPAPTPPLDPDERLDDQRARLRGARLLVVEDNTIIQKLALDLLGSAGIQVTLAGNGREALARLAERPFDGVLMDCQMPVMDGLEATRALRLLPQFATLPVIALTADALDADREHVIQAGMNDLISKPLDVDQMFATLARWVRPALPATAAASPAHAEATDPLAALPGIDARIGRNSTMNNDKLYRRLLGMFHEGQHQFVAQFRSARTAGDHATAMRLAHNLRAVSASLGAVEVHRSASALERACADRAGDAEIAALLDAVAADLDPVIAGLAQLKAA